MVDNGSTDDSAELAERAGAKVLRLGQNMGFAAAVNRGIEAAEADWVAILNNDVTFEPDWLEETAGGAHEGAWFATGKILQAADHHPGRRHLRRNLARRLCQPLRVRETRWPGVEPAAADPRSLP